MKLKLKDLKKNNNKNFLKKLRDNIIFFFDIIFRYYETIINSFPIPSTVVISK